MAVVALAGCGASNATMAPSSASRTRHAGSVTPSPLGYPSPMNGASRMPASATVLATVDLATGSAHLPVFMPRGRRIFVTWVCRGSGTFELANEFSFSGCSGRSATSSLELRKGGTQHLFVKAPQSMSWRLVIQELSN